jgi:hypothetical protein
MRNRLNLVVLFFTLAVLVSTNAANAQFGDMPDWYTPSSKQQCRISAPEMFGDSFFDSLLLRASTDSGSAAANVPFPGGNDRLMIGKNNSPIVQDRIYMAYEHLEGLRPSSVAVPAIGPIDRYVIGIEKKIGEKYSIELRLPFANQSGVQQGFFSIANDSYFGDISAIFKAMLHESDQLAISLGVGVQLPTGDDVAGVSSGPFLIENEAVYVSPFLAALWTPNDDWFVQTFAQFDFTVQGDSISTSNGNLQTPSQLSAQVNNQNLARLSISGGRWFYRNEHKRFFRAMAGLVELHYLHNLNNADNVALSGLNGTLFTQNAGDDQHSLNLTAGLHTELTRQLDLRVAASAPLLNNDRFHDVSVMVQVNWKFGR